MKLEDVTGIAPSSEKFKSCEEFDSDILVGIEIELEAFSGPVVDLSYWKNVHDGSLREGGVEFVLRSPLTGKKLLEAIDEIDEKILKGSKYCVNSRCSTHVHIDMRDTTIEHLNIMVFLYAMFEKCFYSKINPDRELNFYCMPLFKSALHRKIISGSCINKRYGRSLKYSGINLLALEKYGSLEFRMHHAATSGKELTDWVQLLMQLKRGSANFIGRKPEDILKGYSTSPVEGIANELFGESRYKLFGRVVSSKEQDMCMRSAQDIILLGKSYMIPSNVVEDNYWRKYRMAQMNAARKNSSTTDTGAYYNAHDFKVAVKRAAEIRNENGQDIELAPRGPAPDLFNVELDAEGE